MYRWHMIKQLSVPTLLFGIGLSIIAVVLLLPGSEIILASVLKPLVTGVATLALAAGILLTTFARRKPFSVITIPIDLPFSLASQIEELWPQLDDAGRESLRRDLIRTYESQQNWSPEALQQALTTRVERHRTRALGTGADTADEGRR